MTAQPAAQTGSAAGTAAASGSRSIARSSARGTGPGAVPRPGRDSAPAAVAGRAAEASSDGARAEPPRTPPRAHSGRARSGSGAAGRGRHGPMAGRPLRLREPGYRLPQGGDSVSDVFIDSMVPGSDIGLAGHGSIPCIAREPVR
jgi:hypothetical protein